MGGCYQIASDIGHVFQNHNFPKTWEGVIRFTKTSILDIYPIFSKNMSKSTSSVQDFSTFRPHRSQTSFFKNHKNIDFGHLSDFFEKHVKIDLHSAGFFNIPTSSISNLIFQKSQKHRFWTFIHFFRKTCQNRPLQCRIFQHSDLIDLRSHFSKITKTSILDIYPLFFEKHVKIDLYSAGFFNILTSSRADQTFQKSDANHKMRSILWFARLIWGSNEVRSDIQTKRLEQG